MTFEHAPVEPALKAAWQPGEVLSPALRESLRDLNARFLACMRRMPEQELAELGFAPNVARLLRATALESIPTIAACPYALFDAAFRRAEYWRSICAGADASEIAGERAREAPGRPHAHQDYVALSEMALFFAWHLANTNALATRLVLGMPATTAACIRSSTLAVIAGAVQMERHLLRPRWPQRTLFWRRLLAITAQSSFEEARIAQLVGIQLMATEQGAEVLANFAPRTAGRWPTSTSR
ncbi:MAG: hypothetical protein ACRET4_02275 [Steroidobacteraceae bacterium]